MAWWRHMTSYRNWPPGYVGSGWVACRLFEPALTYCEFDSKRQTSRMALSISLKKMHLKTWWRHQMVTFSALLAICAGNSRVTGEFPAQRPVTRSFDVFFDLCLNKRLSKQWGGWWFEKPSCSLWRHCNVSAKWQTFWSDLNVLTVAAQQCDTYVMQWDEHFSATSVNGQWDSDIAHSSESFRIANFVDNGRRQRRLS